MFVTSTSSVWLVAATVPTLPYSRVAGSAALKPPRLSFLIVVPAPKLRTVLRAELSLHAVGGCSDNCRC